MRKIAEMVGVSVTTVSLVLNDKNVRITKDKKRQIKEVARKYNYVPNSSAVSLAKNQSNTIGVVVPNINNPFYSALIKAISDDLAEIGYYALTINTDDNHKNESKQIAQLVNRGVDGILLVPTNDLYAQGQDVADDFLKHIQIPFVLVNADSELAINQVNLDSFEGGYLATQALVDNSHRHIAIVTGNKGYVNAENRLNGYKQALGDNGIPFDDGLVFRSDYDVNGGYDIIEKIEKNPKITAIFFCNDLMLYGAIKRTNEQKKNLFDLYSVVGYDDSYFNEVLNPTITSIRQDVAELGRRSVQILRRQLEGKKRPINEKLQVSLIKRQSIKSLS
nr:LacI family DNA-binding transcriptional regulator [Levilactobacillus tujiorum]